MKRHSFYTLSLIILISCNNSKTDIATPGKNSDTLGSIKKDTASMMKQFSSSSEEFDSIDNLNSKTIAIEDDYIQKAIVSKSDSSISLTANIKRDHRIFGYEKPDTTSKKMILISIFTDDVEGNPFKCPLGSYYETGNMDDMELKYTSTEGNFIEANVIKSSVAQGTVFIEKKWIEFDE